MKHHLPEHITFTLHDRRTSGETAEGGEVSSELRGQRSKLKLRLQCNYDVSEKKADQLSGYLRLDMIGDLEDFFQRKDYYIANCRRSKTSGMLSMKLLRYSYFGFIFIFLIS